jgi:hypothetical protein
MPESFPSMTITSIDVPEPKGFSASFSYNFFVPDEKVDDSGDPRAEGSASIDDKALSSGQLRNIEAKSPRYTSFSFQPVTVKTNSAADNEFVTDLSKPENVGQLIIENFSKIQSELDIATKGTSALVLQDQPIASRLSELTHVSVDMRADIDGDDADKAQVLNELTSELVSGDLILKLMSDIATDGVTYVDSFDDVDIKDEKLSDLSKIKVYSQINNKFIGSILRNSAGDSLSPFSGRMSEFLSSVGSLQTNARTRARMVSIAEDDFSSTIVPISYKKVEQGEFKNAAKVIGYVVDKHEILADGSISEKDPIVLTSPIIGAGFDSKVKYGACYSYSIRAIALVQAQALNEETGDIFAINALVSSRPSDAQIVKCVETTPPPHPSDIKYVWDYEVNKLMVMWNFPPNSQRDIKRFQLFRRKSINDPFTMLIEYDFDDSVIPTPRSETPLASSVIYSRNPITFYIDDEFTKDSKYIYTLCCVDAHDFTSNYAEQIEITFDRYKNSLIRKMISPSGAPKPYPNFYLTSGLTVDSMKDSNHFTATIFFDPEYLSIVDKNNEDIHFLATNKNDGVYKLQILNIDRQNAKVITINVDDLRSSE